MAIITSTNSGLFSDKNVWDLGTVPCENDVCIVKHSIEIDQSIILSGLKVYGTLFLADVTADYTLEVKGNIEVYGFFLIGPPPPTHNFKILLDCQCNIVVHEGAKIRFYGRPRLFNETKCSCKRGSKILKTPMLTDWDVGDTILISSDKVIGFPSYTERERKTIEAIEATSITVNSPFIYSYENAQVSNLTKNVIISASDCKSQIVVLDFGTIEAKEVQFSRVSISCLTNRTTVSITDSIFSGCSDCDC